MSFRLLSNRARPGAVRARVVSLCAMLLMLAVAAGCATGRAVRRADAAAERGEWDAAVASYREALGKAPSRADLKIKLERATRQAATEHTRRARDLEGDEQWPGALAEYRRAAELDPSSTVATAKAAELDRRIRAQAQAAQPRSRVEVLRESQAGAIPRLDPRTIVPSVRFTNGAVRDILLTIGRLTNININFDQQLDQLLSRPHTIDVQNMPLEDTLTQVLQANQLTFKVQNATSILIYQDTPQKRLQFEDLYMQTFYLSSMQPQTVQQALTALLAGSQSQAPRFSVNQDSNTLTVRASAQILQVIERFIRQTDRPQPEVLVEAEILEVSKNYVRQLGLDLSQWAVGLTFSPERSVADQDAAFPQASPSPFNVNTLRNGVSANDLFVTSPTALIRLLESDSNTKVLARPSNRGTANKPLTLTLGDQVPIPTTTFNSAAAGGVANIPTTSVTYTSVGVNLIFTPKVTYDDDIILESLTLEKSGLGGNIDVGGQSFPTISSRKTQTSLRLRDGESAFISGLLLDDERSTNASFPGLSGIPLLRSLFGNSDRRTDQTDIVMIITPKIVRGHNLSADDVRPVYVGTGQSIGTSSTPPLISPEALDTSSPSTSNQGAGALSVAGGPSALTPAGVGPGGLATALSPAASAAAANRAAATELMPIVPVPSGAPGATTGSAPATPPPTPPRAPVATPAPQAGSGAAALRPRLVVTAPSNGSGALAPGTGPHAIPIQISDASNVVSVSLTILYDPAMVRMPTVTQGSFLAQGGVSPSVTPAVSPTGGRIEVALTRPPQVPGASGSGILAAVNFLTGSVGETDVTVTGVLTTASGQTIPLSATPARIVVR